MAFPFFTFANLIVLYLKLIKKNALWCFKDGGQKINVPSVL